MALAFSYIREFVAVDSALDSGASWDYGAGRADFSQSHPFIPYAQRHEAFIVISVVSLLAAVLYFILLCTVFRRSKGV
ncbi:MAG TPA: hypothetical protein VF593_13760 [Chthoniobacteraceae bacterium]|jgi:hypothetical protein